MLQSRSVRTDIDSAKLLAFLDLELEDLERRYHQKKDERDTVRKYRDFSKTASQAEREREEFKQRVQRHYRGDEPSRDARARYERLKQKANEARVKVENYRPVVEAMKRLALRRSSAAKRKGS